MFDMEDDGGGGGDLRHGFIADLAVPMMGLILQGASETDACRACAIKSVGAMCIVTLVAMSRETGIDEDLARKAAADLMLEMAEGIFAMVIEKDDQ